MPAPTGGWDAISPISQMKPDRALVLDNWFPTPQDVEIRRGFASHCDTTSGEAVDTLMPYMAANPLNNKLFAAADGKIFDVTTSNPSVSLSGLNSHRWQWVNIATTAGLFLVAVNGSDSTRNYTTSGWSAPAITVSGF